MKNKSLKYKIIELSPNRWKEFRELRLEAVTNDSSAFGPLPGEVMQTKSRAWQDKLKNSIKNEFNFCLSKIYF